MFIPRVLRRLILKYKKDMELLETTPAPFGDYPDLWHCDPYKSFEPDPSYFSFLTSRYLSFTTKCCNSMQMITLYMEARAIFRERYKLWYSSEPDLIWYVEFADVMQRFLNHDNPLPLL